MALKLFNTLTKKKEKFVPIKEGIVTMYTCGPTVYDFAHIGNFRSYTVEDILRRYLEYRGFKVKHVMNLTDVGHLTQDEVEAGVDKVQLAAEKQKITPWDVADAYANAFVEDSQTLNLEEPMKRPKASDYVSDMIDMIKVLLKKGFAYEVNGSIYFDLTKFKKYGKLSGATLEHLKEGAGGRAKDNPDKKHHFDFALWVNDPKHLMRWTSPWSVGYPGWHIECSVMATKLLGETVDIHMGGEDNIIPHHEAEIAQSEGATGKKFVNYWLHVRHLLVNNEKMSKRKGNFYTLRDLLAKGYSAKAIRYLLMSAHYRSQMNFTFDGLKDTETTVNRLIEFVDKLDELEVSGDYNGDLHDKLVDATARFEDAMDDDLNTPVAFAAIHEFVKASNVAIADGKLNSDNVREIKEQMQRFDKVLGVLEHEKVEVPEEIQKLVEERETARAKKDFKKSDELREKIRKLGWEVQDTEEGPKVRKHI